MKKRKMKYLGICLAGILTLSGCGTAPYALTETEEGIIVNYAAHVVSKYNAFQGDGLAKVAEETTEEAATETASIEEANTEEENNLLLGGSTDGTIDASGATGATLTEVFGQDGLEVTYTGCQLTKSYVENGAYAVDASAGKEYLVVSVDINNQTAGELEMNNLTAGLVYRISYTDDAGNTDTVPVYTTILLNDFSTYDEVIAAGTTNQAVLLFEIPDSVTEVSELVLTVKKDGSTYEINL